MTQSDDNLTRDPNCESKCPEDKLIVHQRSVTVEAADNEVNRGEYSDRSSDNVALGPDKGSSGIINTGEMGSTDSAGNTHSGVSSCGLVSSLFPNSCRGRAESFARRLHRRLTSLGGDVGVNGSEDDDDDSMNFGARGSSKKVTETSWLQAPNDRKTTTTIVPTNSATSLTSSRMDEHVHDSQPRHSPESDVYYDFDLESYENSRFQDENDENDENVTNSPAAMANEAAVVNVPSNHRIMRFSDSEAHKVTGEAPKTAEYNRDSESDCVFESPLPGTSPETDNSEAFFDPESSETEKTCESTEHSEKTDCAGGGIESEAIDRGNVTTGDEATSCKTRKNPLRRRIHRVAVVRSDKQRDNDDDTSESSASSCNGDTDGVENPEGRFGTSSEESLNGINKSSIETTTSPSHESLWSTFDESTLSLQDDSTTATDFQATIIPASRQHVTLLKSYSDSELIGNNPTRTTVDEVDHACPIISLTNGDNANATSLENEHSTCCSSIDIPGGLVLEYPTGKRIVTTEENLKNQVNIRIDEANGLSDGGMSRLLERLACSPRVDKIEDTKDLPMCREDAETKQPINGARSNDETSENNVAKEGETIHEKSEEVKENDDDDDDDDDDDVTNRPQRIRRCSSLKTGKTPPGTPGRKKIVRFADVLGLDLADVRTFLDEIPKIPNSAYSDLIYDEAFHKDTSPVNFFGTGPATFTTPLYAATMPRCHVNGMKPDRLLVPLFQQPGDSITFLDNVRERQVCLENVVVQDPINICLHGTVRVRNLDFHKSVHVRYSLDSWRSFSDLQAVYASNSCDGFSDKFTFGLYCHTLKIGQRLELAVRFQCKGAQYWDNNGGANYCFLCLPATSTNPGYIPITAPTILTMAASSHISHHNAHDWSPTFY